MVDTLIYYLLSFALSLAASETQVQIDFIDPAEAVVQAITATRSGDSWHMEGLTVTRAGHGFEFVEPGSDGKTRIELGQVAASLAGATEQATFTIEDQEYLVVPSGSVTYVMAKGRAQLVVVRFPQAGAEITATGTVRHHPRPEAKTPEAYLAAEFTLERDGQEPLPLAPSDAVAHAVLVALDGKSVTVTGAMSEGAAPQPGESFPQGLDGQPLPRPARLEVQTLQIGAN